MKQSTIVIIVIVLGAIIFGGSIVAGVGTAINDFVEELGDWVKYGFATGQSQTQLGWTIGYADGTTEEVNPDSSVPLAVLHKEKEVDWVGTEIWIKLTYDREASSLAGTFDLELFIDDTAWDVSDPYYGSATTINQEPPASGVWTELYGGGRSGSVDEVEKRDAGQFKSHSLKGIATIDMTIYFADGSSQHLEGTAQGTLTLNVVQTATLDVQVRPNIITVYPTNLS